MVRILFIFFIFIFTLSSNISYSTEFSGAYLNYPNTVIREIDTYFEKGRFIEAEAVIDNILSNPDDYTSEEVAFSYLRKGLLYKYRGEFDKAISYYEKAAEISPVLKISNDAKAHLSAVYFYLGRLDEAEDLLREVLESTKDERQIKFCNYWLRYIRKIKEYQKSFGPVAFACGRGSLLAVADKLNLPVRWEEIVKLSVNNNGVSLGQIKNFLKKKGVKARIVKADLEKLVRSPDPKIVLLKSKHYVVILGRKGADVAYLDPSKGRKILVENLDLFKEKFTGYALVFNNEKYTEVAPKIANTLFGAYCWCCPPGELGGPEDNPNTEYETTDCGSSVGLPAILTNTATLNLVISDTDFRYKHFGIEFLLKRTYNADSPHVSVFGKGWSWYYGTRLRKTPSENIDWYTPTGRIIHFYYDASTGNYIPEYGVSDRLWKKDNNFIVYRKVDRLYYVFDNIGRLIRIKDRNGNYIDFEYIDESIPFKPVKIVDSSGRELMIEYNTQGLISKITTFNGIDIIYDYDANGHLIKNIDAYGTVIEYSYDSFGYLVELKLPNGSYRFDYYTTWEGYALTAIELPNGETKRYRTWRTDYNTRIDYPDGTWISYWNIYPGWTEEVFNDKGRIVLYGYNADGYRSVIVDSQGNRVELSYDKRGNITKILYPDGTYEELSYNSFDLPTGYKDRNGSMYTFEYDNRGNLISLIYPDDSKTELTYDSNGLLKTITKESKSIFMNYDDYGYLSELILPSRRKWRFEYNIVGKLVKLIDPENNTYKYNYDNLGRIVQIKDPENNIFSFSYNHRNLTGYTDPIGKETTYLYSPLDLLIKTCKEGNCYSYERNEIGRITALIDYNGNRWEILRDTAGFPAGIKDPLGNVLRKEYDNNFRLISVTLPDGEKVTYEYDSSGRLTKINYPDGTYELFMYDSNGNILKAENQHTVINIEYDVLNRPIRLKDDILDLETLYSYTEDGLISEIIYPGDFRVKYKYDKDGNVKLIKFKKGEIRYIHNKSGLPKKVSLGKTVLSYSYDKRGLLKNIEIEGRKFDEVFIEYERDPLGRTVRKTLTGFSGNSRYFEPFTFSDAEYDSASQLVSFTTRTGEEYFEYDAVGNLVRWVKNKDRKEFEYGYDNRLKKVKIDNTEIEFLYTAVGYRWKKKTPGKVYEYFYGVDGNLLYERTIENGNLKTERYFVYIPGRLDRPVAMVVKSSRMKKRYKVYYFIHDAQGSVIAVVDKSGALINRYDYWADGNIRYIDEKIGQPFLYTGAYYDRETGLYYLRARYYSPELRRFIQRDPILFEGGINLYSYTGCDFVNYGDWWGLFGTESCQIYEEACKETGDVYPCYVASFMCPKFRFLNRWKLTDEWEDCVRACLQLMYKSGYGDYCNAVDAFVEYTADHVYCFVQCLRDPENPFNPGGGYLLDFEVPWKN